ncbi:MAG TPA: SAM-dependent methyltransferase [Streptosporangiaceae bacterium]
MVLSHGAADIDAEQMAEVARRINRSSHQQFTPRSHAQVTRFFDGLDLLEPGVVRVEAWRPASGPPGEDSSAMWGGVAVKR